MMDIDKVKEAKGLLKKYEKQMETARTIAISADLGLRNVEQLIRQKSEKIEEEAKRGISEKAFVKIKELNATDPKAARELADEIRELNEEPPTNEEVKRDILSELDRMFPEDKKEEKEEEKEENKEETAEEKKEKAKNELVENIKSKLTESDKEYDEKRFSEAYNRAKEALGLTSRIAEGASKNELLKEIRKQLDKCLEPLINTLLAHSIEASEDDREKYLKRAKERTEEVVEETIKSKLKIAYRKTLETIEEKKRKEAGEKEETDGKTAGEEEGEEKEEGEPERKVPADVKELMDKNIFMSEDKLDDALKLVTNDAKDKDGLRKFSNKLEKAIEDTLGDIKALVVSAGDDENKVEDIKRSVIDRLGDMDGVIEGKIKDAPFADREPVYIKMELPADDGQRNVYFLMKLQRVLGVISEDIKRLS